MSASGCDIAPARLTLCIFCLLTVPQKPSPLANESVVSTLIEMVSLNLFKPVNTVNVEPSEDEEQSLDPAYAHTQVCLSAAFPP